MLGIKELMDRALFYMWDEPITVGAALAGAAATTVLAAAGAAVIWIVCFLAAV